MAKCYENFSREELIELLNKQDKELALKKYGLVWDTEKEPEKVVLDCQNNLPILQRVSEKEIKTDDSDYNILIEGDNFHALSVLNYTHKGNIDVIYIDPPYNTGNKDFKYNGTQIFYKGNPKELFKELEEQISKENLDKIKNLYKKYKEKII